MKSRAYATHDEEGARSARVALRRALSVLQRLFAPILPFATEEVWSWWQQGSIHRAEWPARGELSNQVGWSVHHDSYLDAVCGVVSEIRRAKTEAKVSQRAAVEHVHVTASEGVITAVTDAWADIADAGSVSAWTNTSDPADGPTTVAVTLAPVAP